MEVGDTFKVKPSLINIGCYYLDKIYKVKSISKFGYTIYYDFKIKNNKCVCSQCFNRILGTNYISIDSVLLHQSKKEKDRLMKINRILKGVNM